MSFAAARPQISVYDEAGKASGQSTPQPFSKPQSEVTSSTLSTPTSERMLDKLPESKRSLVNKPPLNPGVPVELLLVFLESEVAEPTDPAKPLSVVCSLHSRPGGDGTKSATSTNDDTL